MGFPNTPSDGQPATVNGILYTYSSARTAWVRTSTNDRALFTASNIAPTSPTLGDKWYYIATEVVYEYINDGTTNYWVDTSGAVYSSNVNTSMTLIGDTLLSGNIIPVANVVYSLGNTTNRFKDLFLSGNTIDLGGATIKTDATSGAIALIPQPTVTNPNPTGIVVSASGTVSTVTTTGGVLTTNAISNSSNTATATNTTTFGNVTVSANIVTANVYADRFFYSNGVAFSSSNFGNTEVAAYLSSSNAVVGTGAITVPSGNTAQRPSSPSVGMVRFNYTLGRYEAYLPAGGWQNLLSDSYTVDYLIVAGGGAGAGGQGGEGSGGGGGAGGLLQGNVTVYPQTSYTITVGSGGTGVANDAGSAGTDSSALGSTSIGGGRGSQGHAASSQTASNTMGGGSGGGSGFFGSTFGAGTAGQGNAGGNSGGGAGAGGGGGAGAAGTGGTSGTAGAGGVGLAWLNGTYYAGGGGGGLHQSSTGGGAGGNGGGGNGGNNSSGSVNPGTVNSGGGGGGGGENPISSSTGGSGGSGIVILRYIGSQRGTGGSVSSSGGYTYHTFTGSGSFLA